jgi:hypothetical protein
MTLVAALAFLGTPALSTWPLDGPVPPTAGIFQAKPSLAGSVMENCGGISPKDLYCSKDIGSTRCVGRLCSPNVKATPGYTGSITSWVEGAQNPDGTGVKRVGVRCTFTAGGQTTVGSVVRDGCMDDSSPGCESTCMLFPIRGCECFRLTGHATPGGKNAHVGQWSAVAEWQD